MVSCWSEQTQRNSAGLGRQEQQDEVDKLLMSFAGLAGRQSRAQSWVRERMRKLLIGWRRLGRVQIGFLACRCVG